MGHASRKHDAPGGGDQPLTRGWLTLVPRIIDGGISRGEKPMRPGGSAAVTSRNDPLTVSNIFQFVMT